MDITPGLGCYLSGHFKARLAEDVTDPLKAKALVLDDGTTVLALVVLDLISYPLEEVRAIRELITQAIPVPAANIMISCTHTHTGPVTRVRDRQQRDEAYCEWLRTRVADAVKMAYHRLQPARLATGVGEQHDLSFCRRFHMRDGTVATFPEKGNPDIIKPVSPIDPRVGVLYVEDEAGHPLAVMGRFSLHYTGTDNAKAISADYYGHFATAVRKILGTECMVMLCNGNSGDINALNPLDPDRPRGLKLSLATARSLACEVVKVIGRLKPIAKVQLGAVRETIQLKRKALTPEDLKVAEKILNTPEGEPTEAPFSWIVGAPLPLNFHRHYAAGCQRLAEMAESVESEVQCFRIGETAWLGLPGEIFAGIGESICRDSPANQTVVVGLTNDALGYFPTDHAFNKEGAYETWASIGNPIGPSESVLTEASARCLQKLFDD